MKAIRIDINENDVVRLERSAPTHITPGEPFHIAIRIVAKSNLDEIRFSDAIPQNFEIVQGHAEINAQRVNAGAELSSEYSLLCPSDFLGAAPLTGVASLLVSGRAPTTLTLDSALSTAAIYEKAENEAAIYERWITPACVDLGGMFSVLARVTAKMKLESLLVAEKIPTGFALTAGQLSARGENLQSGESLACSFQAQAGKAEGVFQIDGSAQGRPESGFPLQLASPLYVLKPLTIRTLDDPAWENEVRGRLLAVVNPRSANQHAFLGNSRRFLPEFANVRIDTELAKRVEQLFVFSDLGLPINHQDYEAILQSEDRLYGIEELILEPEEHCEDADEIFDFGKLRENPPAAMAATAAFAGAAASTFSENFDSVFQLSKEVLNLGLQIFVEGLKAGNDHIFTRGLGKLFGALTATLKKIEVLALNAAPAADSVFVDARTAFDLKIKGGILKGLLLRCDGEGSLTLKNLGLTLIKTPGGLPSGLRIIITKLELAEITLPKLKGLLGWLVKLVLPPALRLGLWIASRLVQKADIPVYQLTDAFSALGLSFADDSPSLHTVADSLVLASEFKPDERSASPPAPESILPANTNIGVAAHERLLEQAVAIAIAKGWLPQTMSAGGFKLTLNALNIYLQPGVLGIQGQLKAKKKKCLCKLKAKVKFKFEISPQVQTVATPEIAEVPAVVFAFKFDVKAKVSVSGFLGVMLSMVFGVQTILLALLLAYILINTLFFLATIVANEVLGKSAPPPLDRVHLSIPLVLPAGLLSLSFRLKIDGEGHLSLLPFTKFSLFGQTVNIAYTDMSLIITEQKMQLAARLF